MVKYINANLIILFSLYLSFFMSLIKFPSARLFFKLISILLIFFALYYIKAYIGIFFILIEFIYKHLNLNNFFKNILFILIDATLMLCLYYNLSLINFLLSLAIILYELFNNKYSLIYYFIYLLWSIYLVYFNLYIYAFNSIYMIVFAILSKFNNKISKNL